MTAITAATLLDDLEFSTHTRSALKGQGLTTLGDVQRVGVEYLKAHARRFGRSSARECTEMLQYLAPPTLLNTPEQRAYRLESALGSAQALMQDVERTMQRAAIKGHISKDSRNDAARKLVEAARYLEKLPAPGDEE